MHIKALICDVPVQCVLFAQLHRMRRHQPRALCMMQVRTSHVDSIGHCTHLQLQRTIGINFQNFAWALAGSSAKFVQCVRQK